MLGRCLSPDSIVPNAANPQSLNRYAYVGNNPLRYTDPTGHCGGEGEDCGPRDDYRPDPGGDSGGGGNGGGNEPGGGGDPGNGGDPGGAAAFAELVGIIDQITDSSDTVHVFTVFTPCNGDQKICAQNPCTSMFDCFGGAFPGSIGEHYHRYQPRHGAKEIARAIRAVFVAI